MPRTAWSSTSLYVQSMRSPNSIDNAGCLNRLQRWTNNSSIHPADSDTPCAFSAPPLTTCQTDLTISTSQTSEQPTGFTDESDHLG